MSPLLSGERWGKSMVREITPRTFIHAHHGYLIDALQCQLNLEFQKVFELNLEKVLQSRSGADDTLRIVVLSGWSV